MRKMSVYARKMRRQPERQGFNGVAFLNTISNCRAYTDEPIIGAANQCTTIGIADDLQGLIQTALDRLIGGQVKPEETEPFDLLAHAIGVAQVRTQQIDGDRQQASEDLVLGKFALESIKARWGRLKKWGATRPEQIALEDAVEVYKEILTKSSPKQMAAAADIRMQILKRQGWVEPA